LARQRHRQDERKRSPLTAHLFRERRAAGASVDMGPGHASRQDLAADRRKQFADFRAWTISCNPAAREGLAGLEDERLYLLGAHAQHRSDLGVRVITKLKENQCGTLVVGQPPHIVEHFAEVLPPLNLIRWAIEPWPIRHLSVRVERVAAGTQLGQTTVASDREEPGPQRNVAVGLA
jgi:hypothetical protein